jgi:hypothetical protein
VEGKMMNKIFPKAAGDSYKGSKIALYVFMLYSFVSMGRSLIHFFAPDGGSGIIAGLDLSRGAENIIFAFGLWGLSQIIYAFIQMLVAFRYRTLLPLFYILLFLETIGRMAVGKMKPAVFLHGTPPGGIANFVMLPLAAIMLVLSLREKNKS